MKHAQLHEQARHPRQADAPPHIGRLACRERPSGRHLMKRFEDPAHRARRDSATRGLGPRPTCTRTPSPRSRRAPPLAASPRRSRPRTADM